MKLPVPNNMVGRPSEDSLVRLPESAFAVVAASDTEEGATTVEYALGAVATAAVLRHMRFAVCLADYARRLSTADVVTRTSQFLP